eukprot:TRINITY_DN360_c0_g1_i1.p1 TRINITY_DN360_c0_g1~~TRINITY_DN360_c0_g1_i1.p1  ORF type:complete len:121 (+),score=43.72 TRINITY_DN360_c0_g1_i1:64-426(+)
MLRALFFLAALLCAVSGIELTTETFGELVGKDKPAFLKFHAPWCGHCKRLAPAWNQLEDDVPSVLIGGVDCTKHAEVCHEYGVYAYPTMLLFKAGSKQPEQYTGARTFAALKEAAEGLLA